MRENLRLAKKREKLTLGAHSITTQTEHKCVLDSCRVLQDEGFDVTYLPVKENGLIDLKQLEEAIRPDTCLVSVRVRSQPQSGTLLTRVAGCRSCSSTTRSVPFSR